MVPLTSDVIEEAKFQKRKSTENQVGRTQKKNKYFLKAQM